MENTELIKYIIELVIIIVSFLIGKYLFPKYKVNIQQHAAEIDVILRYAESFVAWARQFLSDSSGEEKMEAVVQKLREICEQRGIQVDEETLRAIAQKAYDAMVAGENSSKVIIEAAVEELKTAPAIGVVETLEPVTNPDAEQIVTNPDEDDLK